MNHQGVLAMVYRQLSLHSLLAQLASAKVNLLAIGRQYSWLITARTAHRQHFIGCQLAVGLTKRLSNESSWSRIQTFAMRHACPGSSVSVYYIAEESGRTSPAAAFNKVRVALYQPPGCQKSCTNGIRVPSFVRSPIAAEDLVDSWLVGWSQVRVGLSRAINGKPCTTRA